jgi:RimJ/RimL family protein N-acetyltransferase
MARSAVQADDSEILYYLGKHLYFRPLGPSDAPLLRSWLKEPKDWFTSPVGEQNWPVWLEHGGHQHVFGVVLKETDRLVGVVRLHVHRPFVRRADLTLIVGGTACEGNLTEMIRLALRYGFRELNLNRIEVGVHSEHWRAIRIVQRIGFAHEGCLKQALYRNGRFVDEYRFAMLRENWGSLLPR